MRFEWKACKWYDVWDWQNNFLIDEIVIKINLN